MTYRETILEFCRDESGATAIEYGLILALVFLAMVGGAEHLAQSLDNMFNAVSDQVNTSIGDSIGAGS